MFNLCLTGDLSSSIALLNYNSFLIELNIEKPFLSVFAGFFSKTLGMFYSIYNYYLSI